MDWGPGYRERPPAGALRPSVACLWVRVVGPGAGAATAVLPDACVDLIWEQGRGVFVAGPDTGPVPSVSPAGTILAGVRFAPGAAGPALGMPMSTLLNGRVDARDLGTAAALELARAVPGSLAPADALRALARVAGTLAADRPADPLAAHAARLLRHPRARAEDVAGRLGVSERQLRRRCQAAVGYGPATLRRVLRFRRFLSWADAGAPGNSWPAGTLPEPWAAGTLAQPWAAGTLAQPWVAGTLAQPWAAGTLAEPWPAGTLAEAWAAGMPGAGLASAAAHFGYADQAHLTRECVSLAGLTPAGLLALRRPPSVNGELASHQAAPGQ